MFRSKCSMRKNLVNEFPEGFTSEDAFIEPNKTYDYQWIGKDEIIFQVFIDNNWINANGIDFDFE